MLSSDAGILLLMVNWRCWLPSVNVSFLAKCHKRKLNWLIVVLLFVFYLCQFTVLFLFCFKYINHMFNILLYAICYISRFSVQVFLVWTLLCKWLDSSWVDFVSLNFSGCALMKLLYILNTIQPVARVTAHWLTYWASTWVIGVQMSLVTGEMSSQNVPVLQQEVRIFEQMGMQG